MDIENKNIMEAHSKTAEKIKSFVDQMDSKVQQINGDLIELVSNSKRAYREEVEELKQQAQQTKHDVKVTYEERLEVAKTSFDKTSKSARHFMEDKLDPLKVRMEALKKEVAESSHQTEEKWEGIKDELQELFETTKLAFHNFAETFKEENKTNT